MLLKKPVLIYWWDIKKITGADTRKMPLVKLVEKSSSLFLCRFEHFLKFWSSESGGGGGVRLTIIAKKCVFCNDVNLITFQVGSNGKLLLYTFLPSMWENFPV
jgi:hypothetical protein